MATSNADSLRVGQRCRNQMNVDAKHRTDTPISSGRLIGHCSVAPPLPIVDSVIRPSVNTLPAITREV